ncbi:alpha/beta fold hydrolase [Cupriavidus sp. 2TAF22]|uniref:alpha/beta fold hydrolase n=1 Tax=unclassified Cupriavidus TaxID=2640874 RepID=UPI003F91312A
MAAARGLGGDAMMSFKLTGTGARKVMLFPGLLGTRDAFDDMLRWADLDAFQYVAVEYRGYGQARKERGLMTLREAVIDATRLADFLGWRQFAVAGHSLGALTAQMLAVALPQRVDAIVSIAGLNARGGSNDPQRLQTLQAAAESAQRRAELVAAGTANRYAAAFARAVVQASWDSIDAAAFASYARDASRTDISQQVEGSERPILVLVGEHDAVNTEAAARATTLQWYRDATVQVLAGAGHYPLLETPAATSAALESFLLGQPA